MTALIVTLSILAHLACASGTRYLWVRWFTADDESTPLELIACIAVWPLVLSCMLILQVGRGAGKHKLTREETLDKLRQQHLAEIEILKAQLHEATKRPLSQGAYR